MTLSALLCGHAIRTDRYDDTLYACRLTEGHEGDHTDGYHVWYVRSWAASQLLEGNDDADPT